MKKRKLPISLVMVVYNEEALIERAIKSCLGLVDEIIIVHDGKCRDRTLKIARKYTTKVYVRPHLGEAEPHKVFAYQKAHNDWVLQLDADEHLSAELKKAIPSLIKHKVDIYEFLWLLPDSQLVWSYKTALFRKSRVYFIGAPHEWVKPLDKTVRIKRIAIRLIHAPDYNNLTWKTLLTKQVNWAKIHASYYLKDFRQISKWNYSKDCWDFPTNVKLKFPILGGIIGGIGLSLFYVIRQSLVNKSVRPFKVGLYKSAYYFLVFYYYIRGRARYNSQ